MVGAQKFDSKVSVCVLDQLSCLFLSSLKDRIVHSHQMELLYACCKAQQKGLIQFDNYSHSLNKDKQVCWESIEDFIVEAVKTFVKSKVRLSLFRR
jgi:hypothetical protein